MHFRLPELVAGGEESGSARRQRPGRGSVAGAAGFGHLAVLPGENAGHGLRPRTLCHKCAR